MSQRYAGKDIATMLLVAVVMGVVIGVIAGTFHLPAGVGGGLTGAAVAVLAVTLSTRRRS